jgi:RNA polymerase sigma factor (sigma-70 family)
MVFADLARKAGALAGRRVLAGWLFTSTRFAAANAVRGERRRHAREQEAHTMQELTRETETPLDWTRVRPVLDAALAELSVAEREAVLLRFFEGRDYASVGARLQLSDNTARMRVARALEKLRARLARRGVTSTSAALAAALAHQAVLAAPSGLAASITGAALGGTALGAGAAAGAGIFSTLMSMTKLQIGIGGALALAGATGLALQANTQAALRREIATLRQENEALATLRAENARLARDAADAAELRGDDAALAQLQTEAAALQQRAQAVTRAEQAARTAAAAPAPGVDLATLDRQPRPRFQARPKYPFELRRAGIEGQVLVDLIVDAEGNVQNAHAVQSTALGQKLDLQESVAAVRLTPFTVASDPAANASTVAAAAAPATINGLSTAQIAAEFEAAALEAVGKWKFSAGVKRGRAVNTRLQVPVVFSIGDAPAPAAGAPAK